MSDNAQPPHRPWEHATGARFEFTEGLPRTGAKRGLIKPVIAQALADAADADGVLAAFDQQEFFNTYVVVELNRDLAENATGQRASMRCWSLIWPRRGWLRTSQPFTAAGDRRSGCTIGASRSPGP